MQVTDTRGYWGHQVHKIQWHRVKVSFLVSLVYQLPPVVHLVKGHQDRKLVQQLPRVVSGKGSLGQKASATIYHAWHAPRVASGKGSLGQKVSAPIMVSTNIEMRVQVLRRQ